jgi:hypothetical protein
MDTIPVAMTMANEAGCRPASGGGDGEDAGFDIR